MLRNNDAAQYQSNVLDDNCKDLHHCIHVVTRRARGWEQCISLHVQDVLDNTSRHNSAAAIHRVEQMGLNTWDAHRVGEVNYVVTQSASC